MASDEIGRVQDDLAVLRRAMGLQLSFGKGVLFSGILLTAAASVAAVVSLLIENDFQQLSMFAAILVVCVIELFLQSRRMTISSEIAMQVVLSVTIYSVVWIAACGYSMASVLGPTSETWRTGLLHATVISLLVAFTILLVRAAVRNRERYYCLGLALSTLLAGMLFPILDHRFSYSLAHSFMAIGFLTVVVIQWVQLREATTSHAAD